MQENWTTYNDTQKRILKHLFYHNQASITELMEVTGIDEKNVRLYLNQSIDNENILVRLIQRGQLQSTGSQCVVNRQFYGLFDGEKIKELVLVHDVIITRVE